MGLFVAYDATLDKFKMAAAGAGDVLANGTVPFTATTTITAAAPELILLDSDTAAGVGILSFQATGANDIVASLETDVGGDQVTFIELDGVSETVDLLKNTVLTGTFTDGTATLNAGAWSALTTVATTGKISNIVTTEQLRLGYDATNYATVTVDATGATTVATVDNDGAVAHLTLNPNGSVILTPATVITGALTLGSSVTTVADVDSGPITLIQGDQTGDPQVVLDLTADENGDFSITTDTGDLLLVSAATASIGAAGENIIITGTSNTLTTTTGTGVTLFDFGTINLASDALDLSGGSITNVTAIGDADDSVVLGAGGTVVINAAAWDVSTTGTATGIEIDATTNTIQNIGDGEMTTGVDAAKIADGSVSNAEYQRLDGLAADLTTSLATGTITLTGVIALNGDSITSDGVLVINATSATSFNDENITNVGQIDVDTIDADGAGIAIGTGSDQTVAIDSSAWTIGATGIAAGFGTIGSGAITSTGAVQGTSLVASAGDASLSDATPQISFTDSTHSSGGLIKLDSTDADDTVMVLAVDDSGGDDQEYIQLDGVNETIDLSQPLTGTDATFTGTTTVSTLTQAATASPTWTASDSSTSADGTFDIKVDAATAKYGGVLNFYVDEGDGAGADGAEDVKFMTINGSGTNSTASGTIEFERIGNFEMGLSSSNGATAGFINLYEASGGGTNYTGLKANADVTTSYTLVLPPATGAENNILKTDGSGNLSWTSSGSGTAWDDLVVPDAHETLDMTTFYTEWSFGDVDHDMFTFFGDDAFGNYSIVRIEQKTGNATDGEVLSLATADNENDVDQLAIFNGTDESELTRLVEGGSITRTLASDGDAQWIFTTAETAGPTTADGIFEIIVGATPTADTDIFNVVKGTTTIFSVDEDGDVSALANIGGATYGSDKTVSDAELLYINSLSSNAQTQITTNAALVDTDDEIIAIINSSPGTYIDIAAGGTGVGTLALNGILYGNGTTDIQATAIGGDGHILVAGADPFVPVWAAGTGTGIPVRQGTPTLTTPVIGAATGSSLDVSGDVAGATVTIDNGGTITFTDGASDTIAHTNDTGIAMVSGSGTVTIESVVFTAGAMTAVTSIETPAIDASGAVGIDIGSIDVTDVTILTDGGADSLTIGGGTALDFGITFDASANDGTILYDEDQDVLEFSMPIYAPIKSSAHDGAYTVGTANAQEAYGHLFLNSAAGAITFTLPTAVAGMSMCFAQEQGDTGAITVQPAADDYIVYEGARSDTAADYWVSGATATAKLCIVAHDAVDWYVTGHGGTWTEE